MISRPGEGAVAQGEEEESEGDEGIEGEEASSAESSGVGLEEPRGEVTLTIKERVQRITMWVNQVRRDLAII